MKTMTLPATTTTSLPDFCRTRSARLRRILTTCVVGVAIASTANAETKLVKVRDPMFDVTGGLAVIPAVNPGPGISETWLVNISEVLHDVQHGNHITLNNDCYDCPLKAHSGPYDQEIRQGLVSAGYLLTDAFVQDDLDTPATLLFPTVLTPGSNAPLGPSFDDPNGPVLPNSIFPITSRGSIFNSGTNLGTASRSVKALDRNVGEFSDRFGETHELDFTGLNYSHLSLFNFNARSVGADPNDSLQRIGENKVVRQIRDVDGNGWDVLTEFTIVAEATDITGDLNYNGELDLGDLNIMTQNVALMPTDGHVFSEAQLRLDMNGDETVDVNDVHHWVTELKSTFVGDTNLDGEVQFDDFLALSANFGQAGGWAEGDFDANERVDFPDFLALSANFGNTAAASGASAAAVPEPTGISIALFGLLGLIGFRNRR